MRAVFTFLVVACVSTPYAVAGTYYASPSGGGNGASPSSPFRIADFWAVARPGDTLLLADGKYTGESSMIAPPEGLSGRPGHPIAIKAMTDGGAEIDGEGQLFPVRLRHNSFFILEGFNAHSSAGSVVGLGHSNHNVVRRVCAWDANPNANCMVFECTYGRDNLFEDCAGWGSGRKIFGIYKDTLTVFRRCFFRWTYHTDAGGTWKVGMTLGYYSTGTLIENCVGTWDELPGANRVQRYAIFGTDNYGGGHCRMLGCLGYNLRAQQGEPSFIFATINFLPSVEIENCVAYTEKRNGTFSLDSQNGYVSSRLTSIGGTGIYASSTQLEPVRYCIVQDGGGINPGNRFDYVLFWNNTANYQSAPPAHFEVKNPNLTASGRNILQVGFAEADRPKVAGQNVGAILEKRYVNGKLTDQPLWPWPMNERIKQAMRASGYADRGGLDGRGGLDLTKIVFELGGGSLPARFSDDGDFRVRIHADRTSGVAPLQCRFAAEVSGGQPPFEYFWEFGDGTSSAKQNPSHVYSSAGRYTVRLTAYDGYNTTASDAVTIQVDSTRALGTRVLSALRVFGAMSVDGRLAEPDWNRAQTVSFSNPGMSDNSVHVSVLWDSVFIYFGYDVRDAELETGSPNLWENDGAEIYLDPNNDKSLTMDDDDVVIWATIDGSVWPGTVLASTQNSATGYTMEIAVPWRLIRPARGIGQPVGLLLGNNDRDNGQASQFDWLGIIESGDYARPYLWGTLLFYEESQQDTVAPSPPAGLRLLTEP